jgi:hypothetical protein
MGWWAATGDAARGSRGLHCNDPAGMGLRHLLQYSTIPSDMGARTGWQQQGRSTDVRGMRRHPPPHPRPGGKYTAVSMCIHPHSSTVYVDINGPSSRQGHTTRLHQATSSVLRHMRRLHARRYRFFNPFALHMTRSQSFEVTHVTTQPEF